MEEKIIKFLIILIFGIRFILSEELNGVYNIKSIDSMILKAAFNIINFSKRRIAMNRQFETFRIKRINSDSYIIESVFYEKILGVNEKDEINLFNKDKNHYWNIIKIKENEYLIQNNNTKKFLEKKQFNVYVKCSIILEEIPRNSSNISNTLKFSFFKLYDEPQLKPEYIEFIEKEPVDVLIKYIDLTDKTLNREGIHQIPKDKDHEELRYCVRSVLENIPWIRKIFILMPNEKVSYFKPIEEIKDKIVYVKDKDLMGYDTANSYAFQFVLFNMSKFGLSENFILMDDDYFIGRPINKTKFFYYDEELKKVLPNIVSDQFSELSRQTINKKSIFDKPDSIDPHTADGWEFHSYLTEKLLIDNLKPPLVQACFTHTAISLNVNDIKEIYEFIKNKFEYFNISLYSKTRPLYCLQSQTLFNNYLLNAKKRKVNPIPRLFLDLKDITKDEKRALEKLNIELFVINTSGELKYSQNEFEFEKYILEQKYNKPTPYEIISDNSINEVKEEEKNSNFIIKTTIKNERNKTNKELNNFTENELKENIKIKEKLNNSSKNETKIILKNAKETVVNNENKNYFLNEEKNVNVNNYDKRNNQLYFILKPILLLSIIIIFIIITYFLCLYLLTKFRKKKYPANYLKKEKKRKMKIINNEEEKNKLAIIGKK